MNGPRAADDVGTIRTRMEVRLFQAPGAWNLVAPFQVMA
jgi:hypothetical protein